MLLNNNTRKMVGVFLLVAVIVIVSCGIKKHPIPPVEKPYYVKRIGEGVYVISREDLKVEGFIFHKGVWYRKERKGFCFNISRYYVYPYRRKWIYVNLGKRVEGDKILIKRYESRRCYAITGVVGDRESEPYILCVDPYKP